MLKKDNNFIKNIKQNIIALFSLFLGTALTALAALFTTIILAKHTTTEIFGNYSAIIATVTILTPMGGFGIAQYWLKLFGQHGDYGILWIKKSIIYICFSTIFIFLALSIWFAITADSNYLILVSILSSFILFKSVGTEIINSTLQIEGKYVFLASWQLFQSSFILIIILISIYFFNISLNELIISFMYLPVVIMSVLMTVFLLRKFITNRNKNIDLNKLIQLKKKENPSIINILKESAPFGFSGLFSLTYSQIGIVFVRHIEGADAAAYYSVALTFFIAAMLVPITIYHKFLLPKLHKWAFHDEKKFEKSFYLGNKIMFVLGVLAFLFLWFFSPYFVDLLFGEKYFPSIYLLQMVAINIPLVYIASSAGSLLVTRNHMKTKVYYMGAASILSLILMAPMINNFGTVGAIYANIVSNIFILAMYFYKVKKDILSKSSYEVANSG